MNVFYTDIYSVLVAHARSR